MGRELNNLLESKTLRLARLLVATLEDRIGLLAKKYPAVPEETIREYASMDPSGGKYVEWLVRQEANGTIKPHQLDGFEDDVREAIKFHMKMSRSLELQDMVNLPKDISKVTLYEVTAAMRARKEDIRLFELRGKGKEKGFTVIYNVPPYKIIEIGGEGVKPGDAINAACYFGINKWCTQYENKAKKWLENGSLWIVFKNGRSLLQTDYSDVRDVKNKPFDFEDYPDLLNIMLEMNLVAPRYGK